MTSKQEFEQAVCEFEAVFHHDWKYTRSVIGDISRGATFVEPWRENEREDWGARDALLERYKKLVAVMKAGDLAPALPFPVDDPKKKRT